jgi:membrane protein YqaA with SNARE-associated domain
MVAEELFMYLEVTFVAFLVNVVPAFVPPTWIVLCIFAINNPHLSSLSLAFSGVIGSVAGRFVMYLYSKQLGKYIPHKYAENLEYFKKFIEERKLGLFLGTLLYSLSPLPSNFLFLAFGLSRVELLPVIAGFAIARIISYSSVVYLSTKAFAHLTFLGIENVRRIADLLGLLAGVSVIFIDWRKLGGHTH